MEKFLLDYEFGKGRESDIENQSVSDHPMTTLLQRTIKNHFDAEKISMIAYNSRSEINVRSPNL